MEYGVFIFRDDEFLNPIHAEPARDDLDDSGLWEFMCEHVLEAVDGDGPRNGTDVLGDWRICWRVHNRSSVSFVVAAPERVRLSHL
ncbi:MAG: hypothetical protein ACI9MC_004106, partial [Kiritimatiellia bacterium]